MRVYADLFFLLNAAVDAALLAVAGRLAGLPVRPGRLAAGAAFGGLYGLAALVVPLPAAFSAPAVAAAAAVMALLAFAPVPPRVLLRLLLFLYGGAALLAGLVMLLQRGAPAGAGVPWWAVATAAFACLLAGTLAWDRFRPGARALWLCDLEVAVAGRRAVCRALVDTGNALRDPLSGGPAVLVDRDALRGLLPAPLLASLCGGAAGWAAALDEVSAAAEPGFRWSGRLSLIPFRTVGTERGLLCGLRPDAVRLRWGGDWVPVQAVLGLSPHPLDPDAGYHALVPACLLGAAAPAR